MRKTHLALAAFALVLVAGYAVAQQAPRGLHRVEDAAARRGDGEPPDRARELTHRGG